MQATRTHFDLNRVLIATFIASLCVGALGAIVAILTDAHVDEAMARTLITTGALTLYSLTALAASSLITARADMAWLGRIGFGLSASGLGAAVLAIWADQPSEDGLARAAFALLIATLATAHASVLLRVPDDRSAAYLVRRATVGLGGVLATLAIVPIVAGDGDYLSVRGIAVTAVLFLLGNVLVPLVGRLEKRS